jgi:hypothetical protein
VRETAGHDAYPSLDPFWSRRSRLGTFKSVARYKDMRPLWGLGLLAATLALASCNPSAALGQTPSGPVGQCPVGTPSTIDRVDFVMVNGIQYEGATASIGRRLTDQDLGKTVGRVRCMLSDLSFDPSYNDLQNGNAASLPSGTVLYAVNGYASSFRLAARRSGQIVLYEADVSPAAHRGGDLLDLAGKVSKISIDSDTGDGTNQIAAISDRANVDKLVGLLLAAPVDQHNEAGHASSRYFLIFHLDDGSAVMRAYFRDSGEVSRGILTPVEFRTAIEQAVIHTR